jgi:WS/DGAT/MGAT family acyltransferase
VKRLTGLDAAFLQLETPTNHMHVMAAAVLDPSELGSPAEGGGFTATTLKRLVADRIDRIAPFRRRLVTVPFSLHHPLWIEDPDFDLDYHVRRVAVPAPGGPRELAEVMGDIASRQLDRSKPLWELWVAEGLDHGHVGIIAKMHHAAIDGASGVDVLAQLVDLEPLPLPATRSLSDERDGPDAPSHLTAAERVPSHIEMLVGSMVSIARQPAKMVRAVRNVSGSAVRLVTRIRRDDVQAGVPFTAPRLPFNTMITAHRQVAFAAAPRADVDLVKDAYGVKVNDVVLGVVAGAMRRYLEDRGELPPAPLVAVIPTSVRSVDQRGNMGNRVSAMFTRLATELDDPVQRLFAVREVMTGAKLVHSDIGGETLEELAELMAPTVLSGGARLYSRLRLAERMPPIYNLVVSNVPGPDFPLYIAGARLVSLYPMGPVFDGAGLNVTVLSYLDNIDVGLMACRESVPELWRLADGFPGALADLVKCAEEKLAARARS